MAEVNLKQTITRQYEATFTREDLLLMLNGKSNKFPYNLPANTAVTIEVPRGGDYAGDVLEIDDVGGLKVRWTETETR